ncbi:MAG: hypothetical protein NTV68_03415, partial [Methanomicrobiales archaeon]|nr:hypothetical protein [Methanomicrobiales archaeon]
MYRNSVALLRQVGAAEACVHCAWLANHTLRRSSAQGHLTQSPASAGDKSPVLGWGSWRCCKPPV